MAISLHKWSSLGRISYLMSISLTTTSCGSHDHGANSETSIIDAAESAVVGDDASAAPEPMRNISLRGHLKLNEGGTPEHEGIAGYKNLAFIGKSRNACSADGVSIIDISDPSTPIKIAHTDDHPGSGMEDLRVMRIGDRDILAIGVTDCSPATGSGNEFRGVELVDVTNPHEPQRLSLVDTSFGIAGNNSNYNGVRELDMTQTPDGRWLALLPVGHLEATGPQDPRLGDLLIFNITDPENPERIGEWGVRDEPQLPPNFATDELRGTSQGVFAQRVRANHDGTRAYVAYWDGGVITLDISDPGNPQFLGRTSFDATDEGNAHTGLEARGGNILVQGDFDTQPFVLQFSFTIAGVETEAAATEISFTKRIVDVPGRAMTGEVLHVGRGCPAGSVAGQPGADPYPTEPVTGKIALIERGGCRFDEKVARAQLEGATGVIMYNTVAGGDTPFGALGNNPAILPGVPDPIPIVIPGITVGRTTGTTMIAGPPPVTARAEAFFHGWGGLRFFDIKDPAQPIALSTFNTPNSIDPAVATQGEWSAHIVEVRGNTAFVSWYNDGVQVIDFSRPENPRRIGSWTGAGAPANAPTPVISYLFPMGNLILATDPSFGLYVLAMGR